MKTTILKEAYFNPNPENVKKVVELLYSISGKRLAIDAVQQNVFSIKVETMSQAALVTRAHLQSAAAYLQFLLVNPNEYLQQNVETVIADVVKYMHNLNSAEDLDFILLITNVLPATIHFKHLEVLFYENKLDSDALARYKLDHMVIFGLRNALEQRIKGTLGIDTLETEHGHFIGVAGLIEILLKVTSIQFDERINWKHIKKVNYWLNHCLHRGLRPQPWAIHEAITVLNLFIAGGLYDNGNGASWYSGTVVYNKAELRNEIKTLIESRIRKARVKWLADNEVLEENEKNN